ncbi:MAG: hypothetical protein A2284_02640 [Deltaproteobacteria bacterium RIFOXYA12_FULL_61_11]|nr:MAG: hypothetical protein A2284_02640 [Deltaproteobacteria bacterium RIFOXYA12_FULL_61_11]
MSRRSVPDLLGLVALLFVGCTPVSSKEQVEVDPSTTPFGPCEKLQWDGAGDAEVLECFIKATTANPQAPRSDHAYLSIALIHVRREEIPAAHHYLDLVARVFSESPLRTKALMQRAALFLRERSPDRAEEVLAQLDEELPRQHRREVSLMTMEIARQRKDPLAQLEAGANLLALQPTEQEAESLRRELDMLLEGLSDAQLQSLSREGDTAVAEEATATLVKRAWNTQAYDRCKQLLASYTERYPGGSRHKAMQELRQQLETLEQVDPLTIGVLLPLSGRFASYGQEALKGILMAFSFFSPQDRQQPLYRLLIRDTRGEEDQGTTAALELLDKHRVIALIGPLRSAVADTVGRLASQRHTPIFTLSQEPPGENLGTYIFHNGVSKALQARRLVAHCREALGIEEFAILYPDHRYGNEFMQVFWDEVLAQGGRITAVESYTTNSKEFKQSLRRLIGAHDPILRPRIDFQALFLPDSLVGASLVIPVLYYLDIVGIQILGTNAWNSPELASRLAPEYQQGLLFTDAFAPTEDNPRQREFAAEYELHYKDPPGLIAALSYDAFAIVYELLRQTGIKDRHSLYQALLSVKDHEGVTGRLTITPEHGIIRSIQLYTLDETRLREIVPQQAPTEDQPR